MIDNPWRITGPKIWHVTERGRVVPDYAFEHSLRRAREVKRIRQFFDRLKARVRRYG